MNAIEFKSNAIEFKLNLAAYKCVCKRADRDPKAAKSALYTGGAYIITVAVLILPFLLIPEKFIALGITLGLAVLIILIFNYYLATAKDLDFKRRFIEMTPISLGVAALSFGVGYVLQSLIA